MKKIKVLNKIITVISVLLFILAFYIIITLTTATKQNEQPKLFGYHVGIVASSSMEPTLEVNEFIFVKEKKFENLKVGDIILFKYIGEDERIKGQNIIHRIYAIDEETGEITTKGDNEKTNPTPDIDKVTKDNYIGKLSWHSKLLGIAKMKNLGTNLIFIIIIFCCLLLFVTATIHFVIQFKNYKKAQEEEKFKEKVIEEYLQEHNKTEQENKE